MGDKTKIDWCDASWNPVTGCLHGCEYCYAEKISERFGAHKEMFNKLPVLDKPVKFGICGKIQPYPFDFTPTFHRYRLGVPAQWTKPRTIFVCSMADLFGDWVPDEWIHEVFAACEKAPQHRYLFLTKNPARYTKLLTRYTPPNMWFGWSQTGPFERDKMHFNVHHSVNTFVSIEPLLKPIERPNFRADWYIVGAETGRKKGKVTPEKEWVMEIAEMGREQEKPVFMKESLRDIMGDDFIQQYPWDNDVR